MPTSVSTGAYIAALHKKLAQAERSLYEFRRIFEHFISEEGQHACLSSKVCEDDQEPIQEAPERAGLYPGQIDNLVDPADTDGDVGECEM